MKLTRVHFLPAASHAAINQDRSRSPTMLSIFLVIVIRCGFRSVRDLEVKTILGGPFGSIRSSVIENWEVVRSSEVRNVLNLC